MIRLSVRYYIRPASLYEFSSSQNVGPMALIIIVHDTGYVVHHIIPPY
jgi:hypothetical protein